jgi:hypothetical protein
VYPGLTDEKGEQRATTTIEFREDGACELRRVHDPQGLEWMTVYEFDDAGRLTAMRADGPSGWSETRVFEYDSEARIRRVLVRSPGGNERVAESYAYDPAGLKTQTKYLDSNRSSEGFWAIEGTDACFAARGAVTITTYFDAEDRPTAALFRDRHDDIVNRVNLRYDSAGHLIEEEAMAEPMPPELRHFPGLDPGPMRRLFRYDDQGRRTEMIGPWGPLGVLRLTTSYNELGDESWVFSEDRDQEYDLDERGYPSSTAPTRVNVRRSWTRFNRLYDAQGNWTHLALETRTDADGDFCVSERMRRTITYFGA